VSDRAPYSRIYHSIIDDPKFATIFDDDRRLATWLRLLIVAEQAYPASANIPTGTHRASVVALSEAGLLDLGTASRYRVHGLEAERTKRSEPGRIGGLASGAARTTAERPLNDRSQHPKPVVQPDEQSRAETSRDEAARETFDGRADLEAFLLLKRRPPTPKQRRILDEVLDRHDLTGPEWSADIMLKHPDDPIGAVIEADKAWRAERIAEAQKAEKPKAQPRRSRGLPQTTRDIMAEMALLDREAS
jgi:hypothetical protein